MQHITVFSDRICSVLSCKEVYVEGACGCNYSWHRNKAPYSENSDLCLLLLLQWGLKQECKNCGSSPEDARAPWLGSGWHKAMPPLWFIASTHLPGLTPFLGKLPEFLVNAWMKQALVVARLVILYCPGKESEPVSSSPCYCWSWKRRWPSSLWLDGPPWIVASSSSWPTGGTAVIPVLSAFLCEQGPPLPFLMISTV